MMRTNVQRLINKRMLKKAIKQNKTFCSMQFIEGNGVVNYSYGDTGVILDFICNALAWVICESRVTVGENALDIKVILRDIRKTILNMYNKHINDYQND